jgi:predicted DCC family thiol-disulfide oxidoreductase YuxK
VETELPKLNLYFDGACPLCRAEIGYYRRKDQAGSLCFVDVSGSAALTPEGITQQRAMERACPHKAAQIGALSVVAPSRPSASKQIII